MLNAWLQQEMTVAEIEAEHIHHGKALGYLNDRWETLKASMQAGDALWSFSSPPETWQHLCGRSGIALVRDGKIIDFLVIVMN